MDASVDVEAPADELVGTTIGGRYRVRRLIGRGGMGAVYAAEHVELGKQVAIKFLLHAGDREAAARFRREARAACQVTHEHVVQVIDVGADGRDYLVMEYVEGTDLQCVLDEAGPLSAERATNIARQLLQGLDAIHAAGLVHRDIKPSNVLLVARDDGDFVKIMDFGIAKPLSGQTVTRTGQAPGTPEYMSPEQLVGGAVDHRADLYAVGLVIFTMLVGELALPPIARTAGERARSLDDARPGLPLPLVASVTRALQLHPDARFASARAFVDAIDNHASAERMNASTVAAAPKLAVRAPEPAAARRSRAPWLVAGAALAAAIAAIAFAIVASRRPEPVASPPAPALAPAPPVLDHLSRARDAEHAGKLDLALGEYQEVAAADPKATDPLFRMGELSERLGRRAEAATYFERYLAAAPNADDRAAVEARVASLRPLPARAAGSGVPVAVAPVPKRAVAPAPKRAEAPAPARRRDEICKCDTIMASYGHVNLCTGNKLHCECWDTDVGFLCRVPPRVVDNKLRCVDAPALVDPHGGDACRGYAMDAKDGASGPAVTGKLRCSDCTTTSFEGHEGDPCEGYFGQQLVTGGTFRECRAKPTK